MLAVVCSLGSIQPETSWAVTRDAFKAPSTLSGAVDPHDWEEEEKLSTILLDIVPSRDGWRAQGWRKSPRVAPKSDRAAEESSSTKKSATRPKSSSAPTRRVVHPPNIPDWRPPQPEQLSPAAKPADNVETDADQKPTPAKATDTSDEDAEKPAASNSSAPRAGNPDAPRRLARATPLRPATPPDLTPLNRQQVQLRNKIRRVLAHYYNRPLNTADRGPWELMHAMLSFEVHSRVLQGGPQGKPITAVGWLCFNQPCRKRSLMYINKEDELRVRVGPGLQGHHGQLLALLAQARVKSDYPMKVDGADLTIADLIEMEKKTCYPRTELTFKLIGLMHYLDSEATWLNDQGLEWDFRRMIREELAQPVRGAACGGTHRLSGLTLAYKKREKRGESVDGEYAQAKRFVRNYQNYAYRLQNPDGSFSTEWFRGPGKEEDIDRRLKTTGHILEWLLYAAEEKHLTYWRTVKATNYLANIMWANRYRDWEAGPLGHAIHALVLYDRYVFAKHDAEPELPVIEKIRQARR